MSEFSEVRKYAATLPMSFEMLVASGAMTEEEALAKGWQKPTPVHVPRLTRLRRSWQWWWADHRPHVHLGPCDHGECI